jgi:hypothetical protein
VTAEPSDNERILRERRPNTTNIEELLKLMEAIREGRREWIDAKQPTITEILRRYPRFQHMNAAVNFHLIVWICKNLTLIAGAAPGMG